MKIKFRNVDYTLPASSVSDMVAFERKYNLPSSVFGEGNPRIEWLCFLAWRGLTKLGVQPGAFDDSFLDSVEFDVAAEADAQEQLPLAQEVPAT